MSVQATTWVWDYSEAEGTARLVLLAIADAANRDGEQAWVSAKTLARMCHIGHRTAQRKISELIESGELEKMGSRGEKQASVYRLPGVATGQPIRQNDVRQNDVYAKSDQPLRQMTPTATPLMAHTPTIPNISKDIYPSGGKPAQAQAPTPAKNQKTPAPPKQGTRVPEDFMPAQKHIDKIRKVAYEQGVTLDLEMEHQSFMNFWLSKTRENTKMDWGRTWENWMLKEIKQAKQKRYEPGHIRRGRYYAQANQAYAQTPGPQEPAGAGAAAEEFLRSIE